MKTKVQKNLMVVFVILTIILGGYGAKQIADRVTKYQSYKSLKAITDLAIPIHASIESLQKERYLSGTYLLHKNPNDLEAFQKINPETDRHLKKFAEQLKKTQLLLLSIPESELEETRKTINGHRAKITAPEHDYKDNKTFYSYVISDFLNFLDKMYDFANDPTYRPMVMTLIASEFYKESLAQELMAVTANIYRPEIPRGEFPLLQQMINDQIFSYEKLSKTEDPQIKKELNHIKVSNEKSQFFELRKRFEATEPDLTGSMEIAQNYYQKGMAYQARFTQLNEKIFKRLEDMATVGLKDLKEEIIKASIETLIAILILTGVIILIQRVKVED